MTDIERAVDAVAEDLDWLARDAVFLGGATIGLYLDAFGRSQLRPTLDVDCIVPGIRSRSEWWKLEEELRARRWSPDPSGPICRYRSPSGVVVDLMPEHPAVLGFAGTWYAEAVATAELRALITGRSVLAPTPALLFACKLEAWEDRGLHRRPVKDPGGGSRSANSHRRGSRGHRLGPDLPLRPAWKPTARRRARSPASEGVAARRAAHSHRGMMVALPCCAPHSCHLEAQA